MEPDFIAKIKIVVYKVLFLISTDKVLKKIYVQIGVNSGEVSDDKILGDIVAFYAVENFYGDFRSLHNLNA